MMGKLYKLPFYILGYKLYKALHWPKLSPISLTLSVTNRCNSRCRTCNLWKASVSNPQEELTTEEWKKFFKNLDKSVVWLTFSGGNQFLRKDFYKIVNDAIAITKPCLVNIPLSNRDVGETTKQVSKILGGNKIPLMVNISLDGTEEVHNHLRDKKYSFQATIRTFQKLKELKKRFPQLFICFNTVVSKHNADLLSPLQELVLRLKPDYWTLEPFQCRAEFKNLGGKSDLDYENLFLKIKSLDSQKISPYKILMTKNIIRQVYYYFAQRTLLKNKRMIQCYAAIASAQISPEGHVWECGTKSNILGNLRESDYDFKKIFFSKEADKIRKQINEKKCFCIQCNCFYTNLICSPSFFVKYFLMRRI